MVGGGPAGDEDPSESHHGLTARPPCYSASSSVALCQRTNGPRCAAGFNRARALRENGAAKELREEADLLYHDPVCQAVPQPPAHPGRSAVLAHGEERKHHRPPARRARTASAKRYFCSGLEEIEEGPDLMVGLGGVAHRCPAVDEVVVAAADVA